MYIWTKHNHFIIALQISMFNAGFGHVKGQTYSWNLEKLTENCFTLALPNETFKYVQYINVNTGTWIKDNSAFLRLSFLFLTAFCFVDGWVFFTYVL